MSFKRTLVVVCVVLAGCVALPSLVCAQGNTGSLSGVVRDEQDLIVPGASVTVSGLENTLSRTVTTGADGGFEFAGLLPGRYQLSVDLAGFKQEKRELTLEVNQRVRIDIILQPGSLTQQVEVHETVPLLHLSDAVV